MPRRIGYNSSEDFQVHFFKHLKTKIEIYIDATTGVRLVVEHDIPDHPRFTLYWEEGGGVTLEEINTAIHRLLVQSKVIDEEATA